MKSNVKEVFHRLRNKFTGDEVIVSSLTSRRPGDYGDLIQVFEEWKPDRKFWVTENAFSRVGKYLPTNGFST